MIVTRPPMKLLLTLAEVAARLGLEGTPRAVYALPIQRTQLSPRRTRWNEADVEAYAAMCRQVVPNTRELRTTTTLTAGTSGTSELLDAFRKAGVVVKPRARCRPSPPARRRRR